VPAYDISSACSSFAVQLNQLRATRPEALPDYVLVVNAENTTRTVDDADRKTAVLWGDCTTAAVVSLRKPSRYAVRTTFVESDPSGWEKVTIRTGGHFTQNGPAVQAFAIRKSLAALNKLRASAQRPAELFFIGHQANLLMLRSVCERGEVREDRHLFNVDEYGNCGAAGAPSVLSQNWDRFVAGDEIALVVVGSGLTWGGCLIEVRRP
jgi:3-oxoacyl-[acyl-carrier-protein] synthase-3